MIRSAPSWVHLIRRHPPALLLSEGGTPHVARERRQGGHARRRGVPVPGAMQCNISTSVRLNYYRLCRFARSSPAFLPRCQDDAAYPARVRRARSSGRKTAPSPKCEPGLNIRSASSSGVFGFAKVRYRGLKKNTHRLLVTCHWPICSWRDGIYCGAKRRNVSKPGRRTLHTPQYGTNPPAISTYLWPVRKLSCSPSSPQPLVQKFLNVGNDPHS